MAEQVEGLEDEADELRAAAPRARRRVRPAGVDPVDQVGAGARAIEAAEDVQERGLARPGRADDRHPVAGVDREVDAAQRLHGRIASVGAAELVQLHDRLPVSRLQVTVDQRDRLRQERARGEEEGSATIRPAAMASCPRGRWCRRSGLRRCPVTSWSRPPRRRHPRAPKVRWSRCCPSRRSCPRLKIPLRAEPAEPDAPVADVGGEVAAVPSREPTMTRSPGSSLPPSVGVTSTRPWAARPGFTVTYSRPPPARCTWTRAAPSAPTDSAVNGTTSTSPLGALDCDRELHRGAHQLCRRGLRSHLEVDAAGIDLVRAGPVGDLRHRAGRLDAQVGLLDLDLSALAHELRVVERQRGVDGEARVADRHHATGHAVAAAARARSRRAAAEWGRRAPRRPAPGCPPCGRACEPRRRRCAPPRPHSRSPAAGARCRPGCVSTAQPPLRQHDLAARARDGPLGPLGARRAR